MSIPAESFEEKHSRIEEAERDFQLALDAGGVGYWHWDARADYLRWDARMHVIFGTDPRTFIPTYASFDDLLVPADRDRIAADVALSLELGKPFRNIFTTKDGRLIAGYGTAVHGEGGEPLKLVGINLLVSVPGDNDANACNLICPLVRQPVCRCAPSVQL
jgi:PAS domain-containing protein